MPKYRQLHVKIKQSYDFSEMPDDFTRVVWLLLMVTVDSEGRGIDDPLWIRSQMFPLRSDVELDQIENTFSWLADRKMIRRYIANGRRYFDIPTFHEYQSGLEKEARSVLPPYQDQRENYSGVIPEEVQSRYASNTNTSTNSIAEAEAKQNIPATSFSAPTFLAVSNFHDNDAREAEQLYQKITGQVTIPSDQRDRAMGDLSAIVPYYRGRNGDAVREGQAIYTRWCNTRGKSGRNYSRTNAGWLTWWLEALAPIPLAPPEPEYDPGITREEAAALAERQRAQLAQEKLAKLAEQKRI